MSPGMVARRSSVKRAAASVVSHGIEGEVRSVRELHERTVRDREVVEKNLKLKKDLDKYKMLANKIEIHKGYVAALEGLIKAKKEKKPFRVSEKLFNAIKWALVSFSLMRKKWPSNFFFPKSKNPIQLHKLSGWKTWHDESKDEWKKLWKESRQEIMGFSVKDFEEMLKTHREELTKSEKDFKELVASSK